MNLTDLGIKLSVFKEYITKELWDKVISNHIILGAVGLLFLVSVIKGWKKVALIIFACVSIMVTTHYLLPDEFGMATVPQSVSFVACIFFTGIIVIYFLFIK